MQLDHLATLLAVVEHRSFTRAAEARGLSQSTVSAHIKALEDEAEARLLDRGHGDVRPTVAGNTLLGYAARLTSLAGEALAHTRAAEATPMGRVTVAASTIPAEYLLPSRIAAFRVEHPEVVVHVLPSDSDRALADLVDGRCDLAIVGVAPGDSRVGSHVFARDRVVLVGPPGAPAFLEADDLAELPLVVREPGSGTRQAVADRVRHARVAAVVGSSEAARRCVLAGVGYSFVSDLAVEADVARGRLVRVHLPGPDVERDFHVAWLRSVTPAAATRAFLTQVPPLVR